MSDTQLLTALRGVGVALVTPMNADGSVDYMALERLLGHLTEGGVAYFVVQGTTGESATTSDQEKAALLSFVKKNNPARLPVVFGVGGNCTADVLEYIQTVDFEGVDAVLSVCPYYNKPGRRGVVAHYTALADACPVPLIMYNIPGRTGINMASETTVELAAHPNIIGIKEASCIIEQCMEIYRDKPDDFLLISGDDVQAVPIISIGGVGVMSVIGNAFPKEFSGMINAALAGDYARAREELGFFVEIDPLLYEEGNPVGVKGLLESLGLLTAHVRLPLMTTSEDLRARQRHVLKKYGKL